MVIQHNLSALNSHRNMGLNNAGVSKNLEKLSSGYKINRAGDDAAGLAISEKMRGQIRGLAMAEQNVSNGISLIQTAEGGLNETHAILQRMRELAVQSANGTYDEEVDRLNLDKEFQALKSEIDRIAESTHYNGIKLLDGTLGGAKGATAINGTAAGELNLGVAATITGGADDLLAGFTGTARLIVDSTHGYAGLQIDGQTLTSAATPNGATSATFTLQKVNAQTGKMENSTTVVTVNFTSGADFAMSGLEVTNNTVTVGNETMAGNLKSELIFQIGANGKADQRVGLHVADMSSSGIGSGEFGKQVADTNISTQDEAKDKAIEILEDAINQVSGTRADLGALQNRLEHTSNNLGVTKENLTAAESSIRDVDMAKEMMEFTKNNILVQASQAMLAQANQLPQGVLSLLR